jgi:molecular chaperone DnaK
VPDLLDLPKSDLSFRRSSPQLTFEAPPAPATPSLQRPPTPAGIAPPPQRAPTPAQASPSALPPVPAPTLQRPPSLAEAFAATSASSAAPAPRPPPQPRMAAPLLIDVTPLSLRVETVGGYCDALIAANTAVPCDRTRTFLTAADGQTTVIIRVAQGESSRFGDNTYLGELELTGLTPAPRSETQIAVTFEIDADGILNVKAKDVKSGRQTQARLQLLGAQTDPKDVEEMMKRQRRHAVA